MSAVAALVLTSIACPAHGHLAQDPPRILIPPEGVALPMLNFKGLPVVEVKVNGKGPFRFIPVCGRTMDVQLDTSSITRLVLPIGLLGKLAARIHAEETSRRRAPGQGRTGFR